MINLKDYQIGDLLLYPGKGWIGWFSNGIEHISCIIDENKRPPIIGEAHLWTENDNGKKISGVLRKTFNIKERVRQFRFIYGLTNKQKESLVNCFTKEHEGKDIYNVVEFPKLWFWGTILQPLGLGGIRPIINNEHLTSCAKLWDCIFKEALGIDLFSNMEDGVVTPGQFLNSPYLKEIF